MKLHEERGLKIRDESFFNKKTTPRRPRKDKGIPRLPAAAGLANVDVKAKSLKVINEQFSGERSLDVQAIEQELNANPALILDMDAVYASEEDSTDYRAGEICRKHYSNVEKQRQGEKKDLEYLLGNVIKKPSDDVQ